MILNYHFLEGEYLIKKNEPNQMFSCFCKIMFLDPWSYILLWIVIQNNELMTSNSHAF